MKLYKRIMRSSVSRIVVGVGIVMVVLFNNLWEFDAKEAVIRLAVFFSVQSRSL